MITRRAEKTAIFKGSFEIWAAPKRDLKDPQARQGEARFSQEFGVQQSDLAAKLL